MTTPKQPTVTYTPLGRVATSRFLKTKPLTFLDSSVSPRGRLKSFLWFLSGSWRSVVIRLIARLTLRTADRVLGRRQTAEPGKSAAPAGTA